MHLKLSDGEVWRTMDDPKKTKMDYNDLNKLLDEMDSVLGAIHDALGSVYDDLYRDRMSIVEDRDLPARTRPRFSTVPATGFLGQRLRCTKAKTMDELNGLLDLKRSDDVKS